MSPFSLYRALILIACLSSGLGAGAAAAQDYRLRPGDVLRIEVIEDPSLNRDILVLPDGRISMPLAGSLRAGGRTIEQVQAGLRNALADDFANPPNVFVGIAALAERRVRPAPEPVPVTYSVYILGEVANPGRIEVAPGTTILQVFALAGGFSDFAARKRIQLRRTGADGAERIYPLNYHAIEAGRSSNGTVPVAEGDTFVVPVRRLFE